MMMSLSVCLSLPVYFPFPVPCSICYAAVKHKSTKVVRNAISSAKTNDGLLNSAYSQEVLDELRVELCSRAILAQFQWPSFEG